MHRRIREESIELDRVQINQQIVKTIEPRRYSCGCLMLDSNNKYIIHSNKRSFNNVRGSYVDVNTTNTQMPVYATINKNKPPI